MEIANIADLIHNLTVASEEMVNLIADDPSRMMMWSEEVAYLESAVSDALKVMDQLVAKPADQKFSVRILWGSSPEADQKPTEYVFDTEKELHCFMRGVDEAEGWLDYKVIEDDDDAPGLTLLTESTWLFTPEESTTLEQIVHSLLDESGTAERIGEKLDYSEAYLEELYNFANDQLYGNAPTDRKPFFLDEKFGADLTEALRTGLSNPQDRRYLGLDLDDSLSEEVLIGFLERLNTYLSD